jgi:hypothetical protein
VVMVAPFSHRCIAEIGFVTPFSLAHALAVVRLPRISRCCEFRVVEISVCPALASECIRELVDSIARVSSVVKCKHQASSSSRDVRERQVCKFFLPNELRKGAYLANGLNVVRFAQGGYRSAQASNHSRLLCR